MPRLSRSAVVVPRSSHYDPSPAPPDDPSQTEEEGDRVVQSIQALEYEFRNGDHPGALVEVLLNACRESPDNADVQLHVVNSLMDLMGGFSSSTNVKFKPEHREAMVLEMGAAGIVVDTMIKRHPQHVLIQEKAFLVLKMLAAKSDVTRPRVVETGATRWMLMAMERHIQEEGVIRSALSCLRVLSKEPSARLELEIAGLPELLPNVMCMYRPVASIQRDACAVVSNAAVDVDTQSVTPVPQQLLEGLVETMAAHMDDSSVLSIACFALKNFTCNEENLLRLSNCQEALSILNLAASVGEDFVPNANVVVNRLRSVQAKREGVERDASTSILSVIDSPHNSSSGSGHDSISKILDAMEQQPDSSKLATTGLQGIHALAMDSEQRSKIGSAVIMKVIAIMRQHEDCPNVFESGSDVLASLGTDNLNREVILSTQAVATILAGLRRHQESMQVHISGTSALRELSVEFDCWFQCHQSSISNEAEDNGSNVIWESHQLFPTSSRIQDNVNEILMNFSMHSSLA